MRASCSPRPGLAALVDRCLSSRATLDLARARQARRLGLHHAAAGHRADRARDPDLGADRRLDRAAARASPSACSRWRSSSPPSRPTSSSRSRSSLIVRFSLDPDIWLTPLMMLGTQWYILFNVIAGAASSRTISRRPRQCSALRGWQWWRRVILPGIFPYYVTGAHHGVRRLLERQHRRRDRQLGRRQAEGARARRLYRAGDRRWRLSARIVLGIAVMSVFVIAVQPAPLAAALRFAPSDALTDRLATEEDRCHGARTDRI